MSKGVEDSLMKALFLGGGVESSCSRKEMTTFLVCSSSNASDEESTAFLLSLLSTTGDCRSV